MRRVLLAPVAASLALAGCSAGSTLYAKDQSAQTDAVIQTDLPVSKVRDCLADFWTRRGVVGMQILPYRDGWKLLSAPNSWVQDPRYTEIQPGADGHAVVYDHGLMRNFAKARTFLANLDTSCAAT